jgi:Holliday junction DNA helicase RuvA
LFYYIKGNYEESGKDYVVIDNNGIGLKIFVSPSTISRMPAPGQLIKLFTYFHVREDAMMLYGFLSKEELDMFELLISVSGVGPKAGLSVLSVLSPAKLGLSIIGSDIKALTSVPGIGSKTAHRIILELKDKIDTEDVMELDSFDVNQQDDTMKEAVNALIALGYSASEAGSAVRKVDIKDDDTEKVIKAALKILMR